MSGITRVGDAVKIQIFKKQHQFIESECDDVFFGGAAGPGKSYGLLLYKLKRRLKYPNTHGILLRRSFPDLERSLIRESHKIYPSFGARYNDQKHLWKFPNGSIERFGHLKDDKSVYEHRSAEYHDIGFDEASLFTEFQITYMLSRNRSTMRNVKAQMRLASNPGGVGHGFLKRTFVEPHKIQKIWTDPVTQRTRTFIPALLTDNPALMKNDPGYRYRLMALPEKQRMALLEGRWDVFEGQFFTEFDPRPGGTHVSLDPIEPDPYSLKWLSGDWGYASPAAFYWHELLPIGRVHTYRELYITQRSPKELAMDILNLSPSKETYKHLLLPPEVFGKKIELEGGGETIADLMAKVFQSRLPLDKANNARVPGWMKMREYMKLAQDGRAWWYISSACKNLIRTLPDMIHDEKNPEDLDTKAEDHAPDGARYGLVGLNQLPTNTFFPFRSNYEKIFGISTVDSDHMRHLPLPTGKAGY